MELYINGLKADLSQDLVIQLTYAATDLSSPAAVKNTFSQQVTLPATANNDAIFGAIFRADHRTIIGSETDGGFNPLVRTPFVIFDEAGQIIESGYLKLDTISNKNGVRGYAVTLYGGLGSFFYTLAYDDDGEALSLGDLPIVSDDPDDKTDFTINAQTVYDAWARLSGNSTKPGKFDAVNFAPAYNGLPDGEFSADKAIGAPQQVGGDPSKNIEGKDYATYNGYALYDLGEDFTEWQTKDLRSYLQRPVVSVRALFEGMTRYARAHGFALNLDPAWFHDRNPYFAKAWMTLPMLSTRTAPKEAGSFALAGGGWDGRIAAETYTAPLEIPLSPSLETSGTTVTVKCRVCPTIRPQNPAELGTGSARWCKAQTEASAEKLGAVAFVQLQLLDELGNVADSSPIQVYTSITDYAASVWMDFVVAPLPDFMGKDTYPMVAAGALQRVPGTTSNEGYWRVAAADAPVMEASAINVRSARVVVALRTVYKFIANGQAKYLATDQYDLQVATNTGQPQEVFLQEWGAEITDATMQYETPESFRSGALITQSLLFANTMSPMEFMLSYTKTFGLHYLYDSARRSVRIVCRNTLYGNRPTIDLEERIDRSKEIKTVPIPMSAKWLEFAPDSTEGEFADYYKTKYGREYGIQKVNTGYDFDASTTGVLSDAKFNGGAEVLELSKYFNNVTVGVKQTPSPFLNGLASYTLYLEGDVDAETLELEGLTPTVNDTVAPYVKGLEGYDMIPKLQCHGADNSPTDGAGILLIHRGSIADIEGAATAYERFRITDDIDEMYKMNDNTPCWNFSDLTPATRMPIFGRFRMQGDTIDRTMDLGLPAEIDQPVIAVDEGATVYERCWAAYIADRYNVDTRVCTAYVNLQGMQPGPEMLRNFYYFDGSLWVLNKIANYSLTTPGTTQCEFVKVQRSTAYTDGQLLDTPTELIIRLSTDGTSLYVTPSRPLKTDEAVVVMSRGSARMAWIDKTTGKRKHWKSTRRWHIPLDDFQIDDSGKITIPARRDGNTYRWELYTDSKGRLQCHIKKANRSRHFGYKVSGDLDKAVTFAVAVVTGRYSDRHEVSNRCYFESRAHVRSGELTQEFVVTKS